MRRAPSLAGLRAFEAVARHGTLKSAAQELCVTPAALRHRIDDLEAEVGQRLLERRQGVFVPTLSGQRALTELGDAFQRIARTYQSFNAVASRDRLVLAAPTSLTANWLVARLVDFERLHPELDLQVVAKEDVTAGMDGADVCIAFATHAPGPDWQFLLRDDLVVVAKPGHPALAANQPDHILRHRLIYVDWKDPSADNRYPWSLWAEHHGIALADLPDGTHVNHAHLAVTFAERGEGIAIAGRYLVQDALSSNRLQVLTNAVIPGVSYWVARSNRSNVRQASLQGLIHWLHAMSRQFE